VKILDIAKNHKSVLKETIRVIKNGGLVLFPSDTVYILAVDACNQKAVDKLLAFKNRWTGKAISIAVTSQKMAEEYVDLSEMAKRIYKNLLPGPFTVVNKGKRKVAKGIEAEDGTLGIRIPESKYILDLVNILKKPITATSANLSGRSPHYSVKSFLNILSKKKKNMVDLVADAGRLPRNKPSTVIDATEAEVKVLRKGDMVIGSAKKFISNSEKETGRIARFIFKKMLSGGILRYAQDDAGGAQGDPFLPAGGFGRNDSRLVVFCLSGELGAGKTVFSRAIGKILGIKKRIVSPTFTICNEYKLNLKSKISNSKQLQNSNIKISSFAKAMEDKQNYKRFLHMDLYRLSKEFEFDEIGFLDLFKTGVIACVEWPENMGDKNFRKLKKKARIVKVEFEYKGKRKREIGFSLLA